MTRSAVIRCDASPKIGSGHVMRCLALADVMRGRGWAVSFYVNEEAIQTAPFLQRSSYDVYTLDQSPPSCDLAIIDHYDLNAEYERQAKAWAKQVLVIDDVGHRKHDCDFIMDYAILDSADTARHTVSHNCICFFGLEYAMLRPEFLIPVTHIKNPPEKIHIFFGGTDVARLTLRLLKKILDLGLETQYVFQIIIADANPDKEDIIQLCAMQAAFELHVQVEDMADLIRQCDLAIGVGGVAMWERLALGIPVIEFAHSEIQLETLIKLRDMNAIYYAGMGEEITDFLDNGGFEATLNSPPSLTKLDIGTNLPAMLETIETAMRRAA